MDWEAFRSLAHRMVDDMLDYLKTLPDRPVWQPMPESVRRSFDEPLPMNGAGADAAYREFCERILPYPNGNLHPRFFGWVQGNGTPLAMMADMLAAGLNPHMAGFNQAPKLVELQVIAWLAQVMGLPPKTSGLLVTGGSMANILGVNVARFAKAEFDVRDLGLQGGHSRLVLYGSTETHGWAQKCAELLGLGNSAYRRIQTDSLFRIDIIALKAQIARDRALGFQPFCVVGSAGTVNTGAIDDLDALADLCSEQGLWFHIDAAFGAMIALSARLRPRVAGLERADSIAFDLHKWGYLPFDCACVLVRNGDLHTRAFATSPPYLAQTERGVIAGGLPFADRGVDLTRSFKALKVWMTLKAEGLHKLARLIEQNVDQACELGALVEADANLELLTPVGLNIACFRYAPSGLAPALRDRVLNSVNEEILLRLQESGIAVPSGTILAGRYAIRACFTNHRTRREDLVRLVDGVLRFGAAVMAETRTRE